LIEVCVPTEDRTPALCTTEGCFRVEAGTFITDCSKFVLLTSLSISFGVTRVGSLLL